VPITNLQGLAGSNLWIIDHSAQKESLTAVWDAKRHHYQPLAKETKPYELPTLQGIPLTDRLQAMIAQVQDALPNVLALTNKINAVLDNTAALTSNLNQVAENARPAASNLAVITANLREPKGSLGEWLVPTNLNTELDSTLRNANVTLTNADTNLVALAESIGRSLDNLANITSNLNAQVQANSNMLSQISDIIVHSDQLVQGLKRHWLLRSAFKTPATNTPTAPFPQPRTTPRGATTRP
jgi:ABC-type transporter Mla subunit MlaD